MNSMHNSNNKIQLLSIHDGKYYVKVENVDIPIAMDAYLYNKWFLETNEGADEFI